MVPFQFEPNEREKRRQLRIVHPIQLTATTRGSQNFELTAERVRASLGKAAPQGRASPHVHSARVFELADARRRVTLEQQAGGERSKQSTPQSSTSSSSVSPPLRARRCKTARGITTSPFPPSFTRFDPVSPERAKPARPPDAASRPAWGFAFLRATVVSRLECLEPGTR